MSDMIEMNKPLECDVLVAGGGVAGLMAPESLKRALSDYPFSQQRKGLR